MTATRKACAHCGSLQAMRTDMTHETVPGHGPVERYRGNLTLTRQHVERIGGKDGREPRTRISRWTWDGVSLAPFYSGLFCRLRCAQAFAAAAYQAGYRRKT